MIDSVNAPRCNPIIKTLVDNGWKEYPDSFRRYARCFFKRFDTPTVCAGNQDKPGIQVCIAVSGRGYEVDICGGLDDDTWVKIHQWSMPQDIHDGLAIIPRLIATWEFIANHK